MHPAFARLVPQSASDTMSNFANNFVSLARSKLRSAHPAGSRDNLSLHRWVLLKNSITVQPDHSHFRDHIPCAEPSCVEEVVSIEVNVVDAEAEPEQDFEDEDVGLDSFDEDMFAFLFPDPGDAVAVADEANTSEEQWLDSLLQDLRDDDDVSDVDVELDTPVPSPSPSSPALLQLENSESKSESGEALPITVPCPVPYPICRPPFIRPFDLECRDFCFSSHLVRPDPYPYDDIDDAQSVASVPDAIDDISDDETDRDSLSTPYSRSQSSLNLLDPALIPLPRDAPEPYIYSASYDDFRTLEGDQLPYRDYNSDSTAVYSPYSQTC